MSIWQDLISPTKRGILFRSYWVHMIAQALILLIVLGIEGTTLVLVILTSSYVLMFLYLFFQFPITGLLVILSHQVMTRYSEGQGLMFRIIFSTGLFVVFASLSAFLVIHLYNLARMNFMQISYSYGEQLQLHIHLILTYITPIFLVGEIIRQRITLKKIHG